MPMTILSLSPTHFRNLTTGQINFSSGFNIVVGENGSGKTSLLEAIYMLTSGRSFRTRKSETIIYRDESGVSGNETFLFGRLGHFDDSRSITEVGVSRSKIDNGLIKIDGQKVNSASQLASLCPITVIEPDNLSLLSGAPQQRRKFVDWGVFHVEPSFSKLWKDYSTALKQRNAVLKSVSSSNLSANNNPLDIWDEQLSLYANRIDGLRFRFFEVLKESFEELLTMLLPEQKIALNYRRGWGSDEDLAQVLKKNRNTDLTRSFTSVGAHRMDVRISINNKAAIDVLSRGQLKLVTVALYLAQVRTLYLTTGKTSVVMVDDVSAELDTANTARVFSTLDELGSQIICTTLDLDQTTKSIKTTRDIKVFHVEQGNIKEDKTSI